MKVAPGDDRSKYLGEWQGTTGHVHVVRLLDGMFVGVDADGWYTMSKKDFFDMVVKEDDADKVLLAICEAGLMRRLRFMKEDGAVDVDTDGASAAMEMALGEDGAE